MALHNIATLETILVTPDLGRSHFEEALRLSRAVGDGVVEALVLAGLVSALVRLGETDLARVRIGEMAEKLASSTAARECIYALEATVEYLLATERPAAAAQALGAARMAREHGKLPPTSTERQDLQRFRAGIEQALGAEEAGRRESVWAGLPLSDVVVAAAVEAGAVQSS